MSRCSRRASSSATPIQRALLVGAVAAAVYVAWAASLSAHAPADWARLPSGHPDSDSPAAAARPSAPRAEPRNVLLLVADDLKPMLNSHGAPRGLVRTPNMDRVAERGVRFLNAHCQMAVCGPSRASFLTSLRPDTLGIYQMSRNLLHETIDGLYQAKKRRAITLPQLFKSHGYATFGVGKVFHDSEVALSRMADVWSAPMQTWFRSNATIVNPYKFGPWISSIHGRADDSYTDGQIARAGVALLRGLAAGTKPWFLAIGFHATHLPWAVPPRYFDALPPVDSYPPPHHTGTPSGLTPEQFRVTQGSGCKEVGRFPNSPKRLAGWALTRGQRLAAQRAYAAATQFVDAQIGRILDALEASSAANTTHVVLMGDHGFHLDDKGIFCKHTNFEQGTRSLFVFAPALTDAYPRNEASLAPVELLDLMPTLADMAGFSQHAEWYPWEGTSLLPILKREREYTKAAAVSQEFRLPRNANEPWTWGYTVRTTLYRFTVWVSTKDFDRKRPNFDFTELYDVCADPGQSTSLFRRDALATEAFLTMKWTGSARFSALKGKQPWDWDRRDKALNTSCVFGPAPFL